MKIYLPCISEQKLGGGFTFMRNFRKGMQKLGCEFVERWQDCDVLLIAGASLADVAEIHEAKNAGKGIVFRVDNVPKKSRNKRARIYNRMKQFGELADMIVFQSNWAREYAGYLTGRENSMVVYNGVDMEIFNSHGEDHSKGLKYLFVHFNRDENKRFPEAAYWFHKNHLKDPRVSLTLVGQFSPEMIEADFDFFAGENVIYLGVIEDSGVMADIYRDHDVLLFPAFADANPNTVLEARACGLEIELVNPVGGTSELLNSELDISLDRMCVEYKALFDLILNQKEIHV